LVMDKNGVEKIKDVFMTVGQGSPGGGTLIIRKNVTQKFCDAVPDQPTLWEKQMQLPKFDPSLGTLQKAVLDLKGRIESNVFLEHLSAEAVVNFTIQVKGNITISKNNAPLMVGNIVLQKTGAATAYDGVLDYAGSSGLRFLGISDSMNDSVSVTNLASVTASTPGETFNLSARGAAHFDLIGPGNYAFIVLTNASADACVTYKYETEKVIPGGTSNIEANCQVQTDPALECCTGTLRNIEGHPGCFDSRDALIGPPECIPKSCNARIAEERLEEFNPGDMALFTCKLTVETPQSMVGKNWVNVEAEDLDGLSGIMDEKEYWFFNPNIALAIDGSIDFGQVRPGATSYSKTIKVGNDAETGSGVLLDMFIAGTDFYDPASSGAKCPTTNQLALTNFRYFATNGAYSTQNPAIGGKSCIDNEGYSSIPYGDRITQAKEIIGCKNYNVGLYQPGNVLTPGAEMALTFKLDLPEPCNGDFSDGQMYFWGEAV